VITTACLTQRALPPLCLYNLKLDVKCGLIAEVIDPKQILLPSQFTWFAVF